jgi:hypothetical protein
LLITSSSASGYLKHTFLNSTTHFSLLFHLNVPSIIQLSELRTSAILFADTAAHGISTKKNTKITKEKINCDAYDENIIISENNHNLSHNSACEIMIPQRKYTDRTRIFIITSTDGISNDKALEVNKLVFMSFVLASSNFLS